MICKATHGLAIKRFITLEDDFNLVHSGLYDYSESVFKGGETKIKIICPKHGPFWQIPSAHLRGQRCYECYHSSRMRTNEEFIKECTAIHGDLYDYSETEFLGIKHHVDIICKKHGIFSQYAENHLNGHGCQLCADWTWLDKPTKLYYLSINNGEAYKIGITTQEIHKRYSNESHLNIEVLWCLEYASGEQPFLMEKSIIKANKKHKYRGPDLLRTGNSEMFDKDIMLYALDH